jgi:hypothetical protein
MTARVVQHPLDRATDQLERALRPESYGAGRNRDDEQDRPDPRALVRPRGAGAMNTIAGIERSGSRRALRN